MIVIGDGHDQALVMEHGDRPPGCVPSDLEQILQLLSVSRSVWYQHGGAQMATNEVVVDERGRTSLARVRSHHYNRYLVEELPGHAHAHPGRDRQRAGDGRAA
jgi:hypothetical protein